MPEPVLGTAHLYIDGDDAASERVLRAGLDAGFGHIDTAPAYGYGRTEAAVGRAIRHRRDAFVVTTKVGLEPADRPARMTRVVKRVARALPAQRLLRAVAPDQPVQDPERFAPVRVRGSVERSLRRLGGRIDRLLLHEPQPADIVEDLLDLLDAYRRRGDVGGIGIAPANPVLLACLERDPAPFVLQAVNLAVGPSAQPPRLPDRITSAVGHGVFGAAGADLARVRNSLDDPALGRRWAQATDGTPYAGPGGPASALLARAAGLPLSGVIVATSRAERLLELHRQISEPTPLGASIEELLVELAGRQLAVS